MTINTDNYTKYIVTGRYYNSTRRFRSTYTHASTALAVNLWNGRVWGVRQDTNRRQLLRVVTN